MPAGSSPFALGTRQPDQLEQLVDAGGGEPHGEGAQLQHLASGASGVLGRGVEQDSDVSTGVAELPVGHA
jgi:hypothetical protein